MRVIARGRKGEITYDMVDRYDENNGVTSMGKTTGYTASIAAQMLGAGKVAGKGVIPPEKALEGESVSSLISELDHRGVKIREARTKS
jgi:saccharopine dehydrogenase-like NADP-dependent oxidoreductase